MVTPKTTAPWEIGPAAAEELDAVFRLLEQHKLPTAGLRAHWPHVLVARRPGRVIGSAAVEQCGRYALLRSVAVAPEWMGRGLGEQLTVAALELAQQMQVGRVYLLTTTAAAYFPKFGFTPVDRQVVPSPVQRSDEFSCVQCASAVAMVREM